MISNCGKSETGGINGTPGDQTQAEYWNINWYSNSWCAVYRHPVKAVRTKIADYAKAAANNDKIGYGQSDRLGMWQQIATLQNYKHSPANIVNACNADCSSSTMAIIRAVGLDLDESTLSTAEVSATTYSMLGGEMSRLGFTKLTDSKYLTSDNYLLTGDVLMSTGHVCIVISDGSMSASESASSSTSGTATTIKVSSASTAVKTVPTMTGRFPLLQQSRVGSETRDDTKACQSLLNLRGAKLTVDGIYGDSTVKAVKEFQSKNGLISDGECGSSTWMKLITL